MALDAQTVAKTVAFINEKWNKKECHLCGSNAWEINGFANVVLGDTTDKIDIGPTVQTLPAITVSCKTCGNTHFINAIFARLVSK